MDLLGLLIAAGGAAGGTAMAQGGGSGSQLAGLYGQGAGSAGGGGGGPYSTTAFTSIDPGAYQRAANFQWDALQRGIDVAGKYTSPEALQYQPGLTYNNQGIPQPNIGQTAQDLYQQGISAYQLPVQQIAQLQIPSSSLDYSAQQQANPLLAAYQQASNIYKQGLSPGLTQRQVARGFQPSQQALSNINYGLPTTLGQQTGNINDFYNQATRQLAGGINSNNVTTAGLPFQEAVSLGQGAANQLGVLQGISGTPGQQQAAIDATLNNPLFQSQVGYGLQGVANTAAAQNMLRSGNLLKGLQDYGHLRANDFLQQNIQNLQGNVGLGTQAGGLQAQARSQSYNDQLNRAMQQAGISMGQGQQLQNAIGQYTGQLQAGQGLQQQGAAIGGQLGSQAVNAQVQSQLARLQQANALADLQTGTGQALSNIYPQYAGLQQNQQQLAANTAQGAAGLGLQYAGGLSGAVGGLGGQLTGAQQQSYLNALNQYNQQYQAQLGQYNTGYQAQQVNANNYVNLLAQLYAQQGNAAAAAELGKGQQFNVMTV